MVLFLIQITFHINYLLSPSPCHIFCSQGTQIKYVPPPAEFLGLNLGFPSPANLYLNESLAPLIG